MPILRIPGNISSISTATGHTFDVDRYGFCDTENAPHTALAELIRAHPGARLATDEELQSFDVDHVVGSMAREHVARSRDEIKAELTARGIAFNPRAPLETLEQLMRQSDAAQASLLAGGTSGAAANQDPRTQALFTGGSNFDGQSLVGPQPVVGGLPKPLPNKEVATTAIGGTFSGRKEPTVAPAQLVVKNDLTPPAPLPPLPKPGITRPHAPVSENDLGVQTKGATPAAAPDAAAAESA